MGGRCENATSPATPAVFSDIKFPAGAVRTGLPPARSPIQVSESNLLDTGGRAKHVGEACAAGRGVAFAGFECEGTRHGQAEEASGEGEGICLREGRLR